MEKMFSEKRLVYRGGGERPSGSHEAASSYPKLSATVCKRADNKYFNVIKYLGKASAAKFDKQLVKTVLPKKAKQAVEKSMEPYRAMYGSNFDKKVDAAAKKLVKLITNDSSIKLKVDQSNVDELRAQAQTDVKTAVQKSAGYNESGNEDMVVGDARNRLQAYKGLVSKMNGKVPVNKLKYVASNVNNVAKVGINAAIDRQSHNKIKAAIGKHITTAMSG